MVNVVGTWVQENEEDNATSKPIENLSCGRSNIIPRKGKNLLEKLDFQALDKMGLEDY